MFINTKYGDIKDVGDVYLKLLRIKKDADKEEIIKDVLSIASVKEVEDLILFSSWDQNFYKVIKCVSEDVRLEFYMKSIGIDMLKKY